MALKRFYLYVYKDSFFALFQNPTEESLPQKQASRDVHKKTCSENMQQIYRRTPMPKCDFKNVAFQLY